MNTLTFNCTVDCSLSNPVKFAIKLEKLNDGLQKVIVSGENINTNSITFSNPNNIPDPSLEITLKKHCGESEQDDVDSAKELHRLSPSYQKIGGVLIHNTRAVLWPLLNSEWV